MRRNGVQWSIVANAGEKCNGMSVVTTIVHTAHYIAIGPILRNKINGSFFYAGLNLYISTRDMN